MQFILYFLIGCAVVGAIGMAIGSRRVDAATKRRRWLKYFVYLLITAVILLSILYEFLIIPAAIISLAGLFEIIFALKKHSNEGAIFDIVSVVVFLFFVTGFILFAFYLQPAVQLAVYTQVFIFDAFSQITGQLFGKHKLAPNISPGKTIEGSMGGFIFCLLTALAVYRQTPYEIGQILLFGTITAIAALSGDLLASWFKRKMGIKDYSNLLPGQGGFLDRFDSFIAAGFVYFALSITLFSQS